MHDTPLDEVGLESFICHFQSGGRETRTGEDGDEGYAGKIKTNQDRQEGWIHRAVHIFCHREVGQSSEPKKSKNMERKKQDYDHVTAKARHFIFFLAIGNQNADSK